MNSVVNSSAQGGILSSLRELWEYRELLYYFTWRDIKVRYRQTVLDVAWVILQPFLTMLVLTLFFARAAKISLDGVPYSLFVYAALVPWTFFSNGLTQSVNGVMEGADFIKKVYFPRLVIPLSKVLSSLVDFGCASLVLLGMMLYFRIAPTPHILWLPFPLLLALLTTLGIGVWLSALNVRFRDVQCALPFLIQFWFFATPVIYSAHELSKPFRTLYDLNPMVGVIEGFRWTLFGGPLPSLGSTVLSTVTVLVILGTGLFYFVKTEETFADKV